MKNFYFLFLLFITGICNAQIINFPDANFKARLLQPNAAYDEFFNPIGLIDTNGDGEIEINEALAVYWLNVSNSNISDLTGISGFTNMKYLNCENNSLTSLQIGDAIILEGLNASHNLLTSFDAVFDTNGDLLNLSYNNLTTLTVPAGHFSECDFSHNQLSQLTFEGNTLTSLDVSYNNLTQFEGVCSIAHSANFTYNQFSLLDLSDFTFGYDCSLYMGYNVKDVVHFENFAPGNIIYSSNNSFADFGNFTSSRSCQPEMQGNLSIGNCPNLEYFILKNGFDHTAITCNEGGTIFQTDALGLDINNCPNLSYICADEGERPYIQSRINFLGLQNQVQVNSYCTFTPGGTYYTINGSTRYDLDADGCDSQDFPVPFQKFNIASGSNSGTIISDASGNYTIPVGSGTHTITPIVENSTFYTLSPSVANVAFPAQTSPFNQDFCFSPVGNHSDLEITLLPTSAARPGFDAKYNLIYRNKGTTTLSGQVGLYFDEDIFDFVSATPLITSAGTGSLLWTYQDVLPFETRSIELILNLNSPTETPAVNIDDQLELSAFVMPIAGDETPTDNVSDLNQIVVGAFDPNDKTCLEGDKVSPEMAGQYVHYVIRFENTGTFPAENIVVKDVIDTAKFDVSSLIPLSGSHPFVTRISNGNQVEFIFENINLPFDDANNDGYVAFKIKTKPTLVVGDTFSNNASIYFDYNFPIVTNTATTTIQSLGNPDFEFSDAFALYPNPAKHELNIKAKNGAEVKSVSIYDMLGQLLQVSTGNVEVIDVSKLSSGNYLIKVSSQKGSSATKFIKQ